MSLAQLLHLFVLQTPHIWKVMGGGGRSGRGRSNTATYLIGLLWGLKVFNVCLEQFLAHDKAWVSCCRDLQKYNNWHLGTILLQILSYAWKVSNLVSIHNFHFSEIYGTFMLSIMKCWLSASEIYSPQFCQSEASWVWFKKFISRGRYETNTGNKGLRSWRYLHFRKLFACKVTI